MDTKNEHARKGETQHAGRQPVNRLGRRPHVIGHRTARRPRVYLVAAGCVLFNRTEIEQFLQNEHAQAL